MVYISIVLFYNNILIEPISNLQKFPLVGIFPYCISTIFLLLAYKLNIHIKHILLVNITILIIWDISFYFNQSSLLGRTIDSIISSTHTARQQISYILPFYVISLGFFSTLEKNKIDKFFALLENANVPTFLTVLPLFLSFISILILPIQVSLKDKNNGKYLTNSQKAIFTLTSIFQQSVIIILAYVFLYTLKAL